MSKRKYPTFSLQGDMSVVEEIPRTMAFIG